jgi:antitoxin VapB
MVDRFLPWWIMSLNIKDPETYRLAQELAKETGETMTGAVKESLRERLRRVRKPKPKKMTVEEMLAIGKRIRRQIKGPVPDHGKLLYDDKGFPK